VTWPALRQVFRGYQGDARDMRSVLAGCLEHGDAEAGLRICTGLRIFWIAIGGQGEASWWLDALLAAGGPALPAAVRGPALVARAQFALARGDLASAKAGATAGLELCRAEGDQHNAGAALNVLSWTATAAGQPREALGWAAEAVEQSRQACDWWNHGFSLGSKSMALAAAGRLADAREVAEAGLVLTQEADQYWSAALFRLGLAQLARAAGDLPAARDHYLAALPFVREAMPEPEVAACLTSLGRIMLPLGDAGQAREYLAEGLRLSLTAGGRALTVRVLLAFADLALLEAAPDRAVRLAAAATALCETAGLPPPSPARTQRYLDAAAGLGAAEVAGLWAAGLELAPAAAARLATDPVAAAP